MHSSAAARPRLKSSAVAKKKRRPFSDATTDSHLRTRRRLQITKLRQEAIHFLQRLAVPLSFLARWIEEAVSRFVIAKQLTLIAHLLRRGAKPRNVRVGHRRVCFSVEDNRGWNAATE